MKATKEDFLELLKKFIEKIDDKMCGAFTTIDFKDYSDFIYEANTWLEKSGLNNQWKFITSGWQTGFERI